MPSLLDKTEIAPLIFKLCSIISAALASVLNSLTLIMLYVAFIIFPKHLTKFDREVIMRKIITRVSMYSDLKKR